MTRYQLDTNLLVRLADPTDPDHGVADAAVQTLAGRGVVIHSTPQNYTEFRAVATRPKGPPANGLGLSAAEAEVKAAGFELAFPLLPDTPDIHPAWKVIAAAVGVIGKQVHDARLVAVCHVHGTTHLLTFNVQHFTRLAAFGPGLAVVHPANV
ncbi:MAG: type II toxin-antitoxin system VapC family toxin [Gemmataceae bacterium]|nr:type II toxin-antitoxin system VapC family toxin [Gemmataceae bacterium]